MKKVFFMIMLAISAIACKQTVESASKSWEYNLTKLGELKGMYPGFSSALDQRLKAANVLKKEADALSDEEAKLAKLKAANNELSGGFIRQLSDIDRRIKAIDNKILDMLNGDHDNNQHQLISQARTRSNSALQEVRTKLNRGASSANEANGIMKMIDNEIRETEKLIDNVINKIGTKKKEKEDKEAKEKEKEEKKAEPIKCGHCAKMNKADALNCEFCSAPLTK